MNRCSRPRYKGAWGGRGSGKSHFFGEQLVEDCLAEPGLLSVCIREVQKTLAQSSKRLIEDKIRALGVARSFKIFKDKIETPGDGIIIFQGMQDPALEHPGGLWRGADRHRWAGQQQLGLFVGRFIRLGFQLALTPRRGGGCARALKPQRYYGAHAHRCRPPAC